MAGDIDVDRFISGLRKRRTDEETGRVRLVKEALSKSLPDSPAKAHAYITETMEAVPKEYTDLTFEECTRVERQLERALKDAGYAAEFANQGSTTNNTHIKVHSDIDLLVCTKVFHFRAPPLKVETRWEGDPVEHVRGIRDVCLSTLAGAYPAARVDGSGAKALSISGGSLRRKVDVVPGSWVWTSGFVTSSHPEDRGVKILDLSGPRWIENYPFHHNRCLAARDKLAGGNLRKIIRFLKSVKCDAEVADQLSSYDISGLCYNLPDSVLYSVTDELRMALGACQFALQVAKDEGLRGRLKVPNGTREVFEESREDMVSGLVELLVQAVGLLGLAQRRRSS